MGLASEPSASCFARPFSSDSDLVGKFLSIWVLREFSEKRPVLLANHGCQDPRPFESQTSLLHEGLHRHGEGGCGGSESGRACVRGCRSLQYHV